MSTITDRQVQAHGLRLHCLHRRQGGPGAMPLLLLHGWPDWSQV